MSQWETKFNIILEINYVFLFWFGMLLGYTVVCIWLASCYIWRILCCMILLGITVICDSVYFVHFCRKLYII